MNSSPRTEVVANRHRRQHSVYGPPRCPYESLEMVLTPPPAPRPVTPHIDIFGGINRQAVNEFISQWNRRADEFILQQQQRQDNAVVANVPTPMPSQTTTATVINIDSEQDNNVIINATDFENEISLPPPMPEVSVIREIVRDENANNNDEEENNDSDDDMMNDEEDDDNESVSTVTSLNLTSGGGTVAEALRQRQQQRQHNSQRSLLRPLRLRSESPSLPLEVVTMDNDDDEVFENNTQEPTNASADNNNSSSEEEGNGIEEVEEEVRDDSAATTATTVATTCNTATAANIAATTSTPTEVAAATNDVIIANIDLAVVDARLRAEAGRVKRMQGTLLRNLNDKHETMSKLRRSMRDYAVVRKTIRDDESCIEKHKRIIESHQRQIQHLRLNAITRKRNEQRLERQIAKYLKDVNTMYVLDKFVFVDTKDNYPTHEDDQEMQQQPLPESQPMDEDNTSLSSQSLPNEPTANMVEHYRALVGNMIFTSDCKKRWAIDQRSDGDEITLALRELFVARSICPVCLCSRFGADMIFYSDCSHFVCKTCAPDLNFDRKCVTCRTVAESLMQVVRSGDRCIMRQVVYNVTPTITPTRQHETYLMRPRNLNS